MTNEEMEKKMQFIVEQQALFFTDIQELKETVQALRETAQAMSEVDGQAMKRIDRLERVLKLAIRTGQRERKAWRTEMKRSDEKMDMVLDSQLRRDESLAAFQAQVGESQAQLNQTIARVNESHAQLNESQAQLNQTMAQSHAQLNQSHAQLNQAMAQLAVSQAEMVRTVLKVNERIDNIEERNGQH